MDSVFSLTDIKIRFVKEGEQGPTKTADNFHSSSKDWIMSKDLERLELKKRLLSPILIPDIIEYVCRTAEQSSHILGDDVRLADMNFSTA